MVTRYRSVVATVLAIVLVGWGISPVLCLTIPNQDLAAQNVASGEFKPGELVVRFQEWVTLDKVTSALERYTLTPVRTLYNSDVQVVRVPEGRELEVAAALGAEPGVVYAEPNYRSYAFDTTPNDPYFASRQWAHSIIDSPSAWDIATGSSTVTIAIVDTGIDMGHSDLAGKMVAGYDFVKDDNTPLDTNGHGTHVAGIAAAITNNGVGVAGMSWGAKIMPVQVLDETGSGYNSDITDGIT